MVIRIATIVLLASSLIAIEGCQSAVRKVKITLDDGAAAAAQPDVARIFIEDLRPMIERRPHRGNDIMSCEHWFGDDSFVPSRLAYLRRRLAQRTRADMQIHVRLQRFDIVEYCEIVRQGNATGAAQVSAGTTGFTPSPANGDNVVLRLSGEVDGVPFDQSSSFDYGTMYFFPDAPSSTPAYRAELRGRLDLLIDVIANKVWDAELARKGLARH